MILLDTHILVWWLTDPQKLNSEAKSAINKAARSSDLMVSSISIWEICMLVKKGRIKLTMDINSWLDRVYELKQIQFVNVDPEIAEKSVNLPGELHGDPADRMIIASALVLGCPLVTNDEKIRQYEFVRTI